MSLSIQTELDPTWGCEDVLWGIWKALGSQTRRKTTLGGSAFRQLSDRVENILRFAGALWAGGLCMSEPGMGREQPTPTPTGSVMSSACHCEHGGNIGWAKHRRHVFLKHFGLQLGTSSCPGCLKNAPQMSEIRRYFTHRLLNLPVSPSARTELTFSGYAAGFYWHVALINEAR